MCRHGARPETGTGNHGLSGQRSGAGRWTAYGLMNWRARQPRAHHGEMLSRGWWRVSRRHYSSSGILQERQLKTRFRWAGSARHWAQTRNVARQAGRSSAATTESPLTARSIAAAMPAALAARTFTVAAAPSAAMAPAAAVAARVGADSARNAPRPASAARRAGRWSARVTAWPPTVNATVVETAVAPAVAIFNAALAFTALTARVAGRGLAPLRPEGWRLAHSARHRHNARKQAELLFVPTTGMTAMARLTAAATRAGRAAESATAQTAVAACTVWKAAASTTARPDCSQVNAARRPVSAARRAVRSPVRTTALAS